MQRTFRSRRNRHGYSANINVVPYIDVMLVLLVVFMITAPLLNAGFDVDLPKANAAPIKVETTKQRLVASLNVKGEYFLVTNDIAEPMTLAQLRSQVRQVLKRDAQTNVFIKADHRVDYGRVVQLMAVLNEAGAEKVGLITDTPEDEPI